MAQALSRKYRPKNFKDFLGQETNVLIIQNAAKNNSLGQAYLFYGPRGTGKTTAARLIAKLLNCEKRSRDPKFRSLGEPCGECRSCREIDLNSSLDVIEIDAASNRGIDEIRNLKEAIKTSPAGGDFKVYIIDEAHMLTPPAFNALLKTLEEPPAHAVFILATTEYEKIPATITSRTQRFLFKRLSKVEILKKLETIAASEKISISPEALELIAAAAEGSVRDAESLLDQIKSAEKNVDLEVAERLTGRIGFQRVEELADLILQAKTKEALDHLAKTYEEGHNLVQMVKDLIHYLRKVLSLGVAPELEEYMKRELTKEELVRLKNRTRLAPPQRQLGIIRALIRAYSEMRYSPFQTVPLEMAIIETATL